MKLIYREAKTEDVLKLSVLFKTVYICIYGREGVSDEFANFVTSRFSTEQISNDIQSQQSKLFVACLDENLVGALQIDLEKEAPIQNIISAQINKLYILPEFQGKGVAHELMKRGEEYLQSLNEKEAWLITWEKNPRAINFYEKEGYKIIGTAPFPMEINTYNNYVMSKAL